MFKWLPSPTRNPEFWIRVLQVLKTIAQLCQVWKSR
jgi:hypothetical protein